jgi:hypothetical protein
LNGANSFATPFFIYFPPLSMQLEVTLLTLERAWEKRAGPDHQMFHDYCSPES